MSNTTKLLILATRNPKKGEEMLLLMAPPWEPASALRFELKTLADCPGIPEVVEDAPTFGGNACKKASETAQALGAWVVADDSGLTVDALGGAPGVLSARYAGSHGDDQANNARLLADLSNIEDRKRSAGFVCSMAVSDPEGVIRAQVEASCRGLIVREPRGSNGFGYDPLFMIKEYHKTFGELGALVKHQISHRARAFARLRPLLDELFRARG